MQLKQKLCMSSQLQMVKMAHNKTILKAMLKQGYFGSWVKKTSQIKTLSCLHAI